MQRCDYLKVMSEEAGDALVVVAHAAREWNAARPTDGNFRIRTLGLTSSTALGIALALPHRKVIAIDGDGAFLMNLCGLPTIARQNPPNLIHVLFDNERYETAGGDSTATATGADAVALAKGAGYRNALWVKGAEDFRRELVKAKGRDELCLIAAKVEPGAPQSVSFPIDEIENKYRFIRHIEATEKKRILPVADHGASVQPPASSGVRDRLQHPRAHAAVIVEGLRKAGIDFVATLPDEKYAALVREVEESGAFQHVPLCREEEGIAICAGAYLAGRKTAVIMQNGGFLNSCNALTTLSLQYEIPNLLLIYYAGDLGDRGFTTLGAVTEPVLDGLGIRTTVLRRIDDAEETLVDAQILASDAKRPVAVLLTKAALGVKRKAA